jgi:amino acid transporter
VFAEFVNETGVRLLLTGHESLLTSEQWPDGIAFILGLLQSTFGLTGFDAISHMVEEMPRPSITAPKVM